MIKVLFVCLGNICRSPMAEAMFRDLIKREGLEYAISVDSAGTGNWHIGKPPHKGTRDILQKYKINTEGLIARQIKLDDLAQFEYIIAMDYENVQDILKLRNGNHRHVLRLLDLVEALEEKNVPDPYFTGNFEEVYKLVTLGCEALLEKIKSEHGL